LLCFIVVVTTGAAVVVVVVVVVEVVVVVVVHYKNPRIDTGKSEEEKSRNYPERYPYRFQQQQKGGKYPDYEDRMRYNWPEYYDDQSEYSDFHQQYPRPGKKMDMYEDMLEGGTSLL
jgi:hypothetical protein